MRVLDRYLVSGFVKALGYCLLIFLVLFITIDLFNNLDELLKNSVKLNVILSYYFYLFPSIFIQVAPVGTLVAVLYTLGLLNRSHELVAMKASGVSTLHILYPYLFIGILVSFLAFLVEETVVPRTAITSTAIRESLIERGKKNLTDQAISNVTISSGKNRMIFAREYVILSKTLYDVVILEENPNMTVKSKLIAKKANYEDDQWVFRDVVVYRLNHRGDMVGEPDFRDKMALDIPERPDDLVKKASQVEFMNSRQLREYLSRLTGSKAIQRLSVDLHTKVSFPFVSFIVILIGAPLAMRTERGSMMVGIGTSLVVVILYYGIHSICLALGKGGHLPPFVAAWMTNVLFAGVGIYLIRRNA
ncbi:MAG: LPS export ABC transporter permease LptG [Candidatus Omnitrophica bacterium]|nr:LPS export ABC transporter permease LptG [Candidatus Omnitrophota bacterium]